MTAVLVVTAVLARPVPARAEPDADLGPRRAERAVGTVELQHGVAVRGKVLGKRGPGGAVLVESTSGWRLELAPVVLARPPAVADDLAGERAPGASSGLTAAQTWGVVLFGFAYAGQIAGTVIGCEKSGSNCDEDGQRAKAFLPLAGPFWVHESTTSYTGDQEDLALKLTILSTAVQGLGLGLILLGGNGDAPPATTAAAGRPRGWVGWGAVPARGGAFAGAVGAF